MRKPVRRIGHAAVAKGWRKALADRVVPPAARVAPVAPERIRTALGLAFLALSTKYLLGTVRRFRQRVS